eukprot:gene12756-2030_t
MASPSPPQSRTVIRHREFDAQIKGGEGGELDMPRIRQLCHAGIPDFPGMRAMYWKVILGYLPDRTSEWEGMLAKQRGYYSEYIKEFILDTHSTAAVEQDPLGALVADPLGALALDDEDDGGRAAAAAPAAANAWDTYFKDNTTIEQIDKDVKRLCPEFAFFQGETYQPPPEGAKPLHLRVGRRMLSSESITGKGASGVGKRNKRESTETDGSTNAPVSTKDGGEFHWEVIERILFVYAKLNPGIGYIQGMNEILGPLYYVMASNPDEEWRKHAEADTCHCFILLLTDFRDNFVKSLDDSDMGIGATLARLEQMVKVHDPPVQADLEVKGIKPMFYAFRWCTCLLSQEFALPDIIRLYDSLFSKNDKKEYLLCMCTSMLTLVRDDILKGGFADCVKLLQHLPPMEPREILMKADLIQKAEASSGGFR